MRVFVRAGSHGASAREPALQEALTRTEVAARLWLRAHPDVADVGSLWGDSSEGTVTPTGAIAVLLRDIAMLARAGGNGQTTAPSSAGDAMDVNVAEVMVVGPPLAALLVRIHALLTQFPDNAVLQVRRPSLTVQYVPC